MHMCHLVTHMGISEPQHQGGPKRQGNPSWSRTLLCLCHNPSQHLPQTPWGHRWAATLQGYELLWQ